LYTSIELRPVIRYLLLLSQPLAAWSCDVGAELVGVRLEFLDQPWLYSALPRQNPPN
jgi:hypothetical protein